MKRRFIYIQVILILGMIFSCTTTNIRQITSSEKSDPLYLEIEKLGQELTVKNNVPGIAIAVIRDGKIAWIQSIGYANLASKQPVTPETIFNVGSVSKLVSSWGFMQLTEKGLLKLDDSVDPALTR